MIQGNVEDIKFLLNNSCSFIYLVHVQKNQMINLEDFVLKKMGYFTNVTNVTKVHLSEVIGAAVWRFSKNWLFSNTFKNPDNPLRWSQTLKIYSRKENQWHSYQGAQRVHGPSTLISEANKVQQFLFQSSGILLFMCVQKLCRTEILRILPVML